MKDISFLILGYNNPADTIRCLDSIVKFENDTQVLFLDNGSRNGLFDLVNDKYGKDSNFTLFQSHKNLGVIVGRNYLFDKVKTKYIISLDSDAYLANNVSNRVIARLSDKSVGIYGRMGILFSDQLDPYVYENNACEVDAITGGYCQSFRSDLLKEIGLLDTNFIMYGDEDFDFCLRTKQKGYKIIADKNLQVFHNDNPPSVVEKYKNQYIEKNHRYFVNKWIKHQDLLEINRQQLNFLKCAHCQGEWKRI